MHYWINPGLEKTICADGTIFFHIPIDKNMVMKNPVPCKKDAQAAIRRWYQTFEETLMQHLLCAPSAAEFGYALLVDDLPS